jgi:hypothetical protein
MDEPLSPAIRVLLFAAGALAIIAGPVLFLFPHQTETYFAWTIRHPLTPVFMGAGYCGAAGLIPVLRSNRWSLARVQMPFICVFGSTQLLATLLHLTAFNWSHPIAWAWLAVYVASPPAAIWLTAATERRYVPPQPRGWALPGLVRAIILLYGLLVGAVGLVMMASPSAAAGFWPWTLTPLTSRVIGGWLLAIAALQLTLSRQRSLETAWVALMASTLVSGLLLLGAGLHRTEFDGPLTAVYVYLVAIMLLGVISGLTWLRGARARTAEQAA